MKILSAILLCVVVIFAGFSNADAKKIHKHQQSSGNGERPSNRPITVCSWWFCPKEYSWRDVTVNDNCNWWTRCVDDRGYLGEDCGAVVRKCQSPTTCKKSTEKFHGPTCQL